MKRELYCIRDRRDKTLLRSGCGKWIWERKSARDTQMKIAQMHNREAEPVDFQLVEPGTVVGIDNEDFQTMLICAERYAQSYMPKLVVDFITPMIPRLSERTLGAMSRDLDDPVCGFGDPEIDAPLWLEFRGKIRKELEGRKHETD